MQLMPATAREVERKIGSSSVGLDDIEHNIKLGTWYLADVRTAQAAKPWPPQATMQAQAAPANGVLIPLWKVPIYAETIPFNETA